VDTKERSRRHFDRWAARYERDRASRRLAELQRVALDALKLHPGDRLLDVGCGTGAAVRLAAPEVERATGVDLSPAMIERARELAAGLDNVEFLEADSEHLPFDDGAFTAVICTTSFHHYPNPSYAAAEMARVLETGGRVVIGDGCTDNLIARLLDRGLRIFQPSHVGFRRSHELAGLMADAGLTPQTPRLLWHGGYVVIRAEAPWPGPAHAFG
jgi:ubiquinone/menaquinone biosynthesis C-methylase UbiE